MTDAIVPWTLVFTRGCLKVVVLTEPNAMLNKSQKLANFAKNNSGKKLGSHDLVAEYNHPNSLVLGFAYFLAWASCR